MRAANSAACEVVLNPEVNRRPLVGSRLEAFNPKERTKGLLKLEVTWESRYEMDVGAVLLSPARYSVNSSSTLLVELGDGWMQWQDCLQAMF